MKNKPSITQLSTSDQVRYGYHRSSLEPFLGSVAGARVLDVGCGVGGMANSLREHGATFVAGVEPDSAHAALAQAHYDEMYLTTVEAALTGPLQGTSWDFLVLADVLEHLVDPWQVLRDLAELLPVGGRALIVVPNVAHKSVIGQLVKRRSWAYTPTGMFDATHLRWFGRDNLLDLVDQAGLQPQILGGSLTAGFGKLTYSRELLDISGWPLYFIYHFRMLVTKNA